ncbi:MAG: TIGR02444 family protein [Pseudomonadota bacterium]
MLPLWDYALAVYKLPGVKDRLLALQDRHRLDVVHILWCLWAGRYGFSFSPEERIEVLKSTRDMAFQATQPLRAVRKFLSGPRPGFPQEDIRSLREDVLRLEIKSEELALRRLDQTTQEVADEPPADQGDMIARATLLFDSARAYADTPLVIGDKETAGCAASLFQEVCKAAQEDGP